MEYPTNVTVKGHNYRIEYVDTPQEVDVDFERGLWLGQCAGDVIRVLRQQEPLSIMDTLIHEILHAVFNRNKMLKAALQSEAFEEPFIDNLASELASLLAANGWVATPQADPPITERIVPNPLGDCK